MTCNIYPLACINCPHSYGWIPLLCFLAMIFAPSSFPGLGLLELQMFVSALNDRSACWFLVQIFGFLFLSFCSRSLSGPVFQISYLLRLLNNPVIVFRSFFSLLVFLPKCIFTRVFSTDGRAEWIEEEVFCCDGLCYRHILYLKQIINQINQKKRAQEIGSSCNHLSTFLYLSCNTNLSLFFTTSTISTIYIRDLQNQCYSFKSYDNNIELLQQFNVIRSQGYRKSLKGSVDKIELLWQFYKDNKTISYSQKRQYSKRITYIN